MDQGAGLEISTVLLATRLWRVLSEPKSAQCRSRIRWASGRAPSGPVVFKRSIAIFCANMVSNSTNATSGIEASVTLDSRFQRSSGEQLFPGTLPQACHEPAPLALNTYERGALDPPTPTLFVFFSRRSGSLFLGCPRRHYSPELIASKAARDTWIPPDRQPLPF
jgi:hypothetical protein